MKLKLLLSICVLVMLSAKSQHKDAIFLKQGRFTTGDNVSFSSNSYDDSNWKILNTNSTWQSQGYNDYHGYAWYRIHVIIPSSLKKNGFGSETLRIFLAHINDADETYLNETKIGKTGAYPNEPGGYISKWMAERTYYVATDSPAIKWDQDNIISIKVYDGGGTGGMFKGMPFIDMLQKSDGISLSLPSEAINYISVDKAIIPLNIVNKNDTFFKGKLTYEIYDAINKKILSSKTQTIEITPFLKKQLEIEVPNRLGIETKYSFLEERFPQSYLITSKQTIPYILTPAPLLTPKINSPKVFGVKPGSPIMFKIAATGKKPLTYNIINNKTNISIDKNTGILSGSISEKGEHELQIEVSNELGKSQQQLKIKVGDVLSLTPPMGWSSWNCWGLSVNEERVKSSAQSLIDKGLIDHGWSYINVDDGWEMPKRNADSTIVSNQKFPDMKRMGDWLHDQGLKFGIYSSPGPLTCGGFLGSYKNELIDATTYAKWGVDYLKHDWCSYDKVVKNDNSLEAYILPYTIMQKALRQQKRDIVYSLCQYGMKEVWKWGSQVDAQLWRTTEDIEDTWESLKSIGFEQAPLHSYAKPGNWNDPDMLIVGQVGWGENLHPTRLTVDEQYTHISLWCMLSAPLLIGCDISKLDPFTINLLTNDEVIAIDQDVLGKQARQIINNETYQVWVKELEDGGNAVAIFNMDSKYQNISINWKDIGITGKTIIRDVWRQKDIGKIESQFSSTIAPHGVVLVKLK
jgi:alpha-galactosidase